jgi:ADP-ribose pyrophosphatase YjhB (NUDIX family)
MNLRRLALSTAHLGYDVMRAGLFPIGLGVRMMLVRQASVLLVYHSYVPGWHLPGGALKRGETLVEAAQREAYEEAGVVMAEAPRLLGIFLGETRGRWDHTAVFVGEHFALQPPTDRWEIVGRAFFALDELPPGTTRGYRQVVAQYRNNGGPQLGRW